MTGGSDVGSKGKTGRGNRGGVVTGLGVEIEDGEKVGYRHTVGELTERLTGNGRGVMGAQGGERMPP